MNKMRGERRVAVDELSDRGGRRERKKKRRERAE